MEIIPLRTSQLDRAAAVAAAAFFNYPEMTFYFPDPRRRARSLPWYLRNVLRCALRYGEAYTTAEIGGVAFTLPHDHFPLSQGDYARCGFFFTPWVMGFRNFRRSMQCEDFLARTHQELMAGRPHVYLWGLVVDPQRQRQGIGSALLSFVQERAGVRGLPVYLETHDPNNVAYYQGHGFRLLRSTRIPACDLPLWCMANGMEG